jgi:four helix bundle protein
MTGDKRRSDLEQRMVVFALSVIQIVESLPDSRAGNHMAGQLLRWATAPAVSYGEAQNAESRMDFIDKMRSALQALRATRVWLQLVDGCRLIGDTKPIVSAMGENEQLIPIFASSINTATRNLSEGRGPSNPKPDGEKRGARRSFEQPRYGG